MTCLFRSSDISTSLAALNAMRVDAGASALLVEPFVRNDAWWRRQDAAHPADELPDMRAFQVPLVIVLRGPSLETDDRRRRTAHSIEAELHAAGLCACRTGGLAQGLFQLRFPALLGGGC